MTNKLATTHSIRMIKILVINLLILSALSMPAITSAQTLSDTVAMMYQNYIDLMKQNQILTDSLTNINRNMSSLNNSWTDVGEKLERINSDLSNSLETVNRLTKNDLLTKEARLNTKKQKILATSTFIRAANNSFDAIDAQLANSDYLVEVSNLSNPTNTDLGFSLTDEISTILNDKILKNRSKVGNSRSGKIMKFVQEIIKNPVVTTFTNSVPALSSINAVVNLVSGLVVSDKKTSVDDFTEFKKELEKFVLHYEALAKANTQFDTKIDKLRTQTEALRVIVRNFVTERILTTSPGVQIDDELALHQVISQYYDRRDLEVLIEEILEPHQKNGVLQLQPALNEKRLDYPFYAINQAQFIQQELESITNLYLAAYQQYHEEIVTALIKSKAISKEPNKIDLKVKSLEGKLKVSIEAFKRNVKINEVNKNLQRIPTL